MKSDVTRRAATIIAGLGLATLIASTPTPGLASSARITVPDPGEAPPLQQQGHTDAGTALIEIDGKCFSIPVRFVAGVFDGGDFAPGDGDPIRLQIMNAALARALHAGRDLISEDHKVVIGRAGDAPDIVIEPGLPTGASFVINAASSILADVLDLRPSPAPCSGMDATTPEPD
ncbi:hypothetical protein [Frigidibacter sp. ROC022]|uniref:hypothetical protein n=1 Tax=Frigidibacter sp. ROC022 TaxID=2971796 RepID=UPI00215B2B24|nr:hypothetical protein [Frigidibacter sp. ROC022]MCR8723499.1 hypothetical protein [Frigidibacter sp. ROC022]